MGRHIFAIDQRLNAPEGCPELLALWPCNCCQSALPRNTAVVRLSPLRLVLVAALRHSNDSGRRDLIPSRECRADSVRGVVEARSIPASEDVSFDRWETTNPAGEWLDPESPPCQMAKPDRLCGFCTWCGAPRRECWWTIGGRT